MKTLNLILLSVITITFFSCNSTGKKSHPADHENTHAELNAAHDDSAHAVENAHWAYEGESGPENWANLCPAYSTCNGERQSPIDLTSSLAISTDVKIKSSYKCFTGLEFINNGHSVQVNFASDSNKLEVNGKVFTLKQFHFHCPSEHTIDGEPMPSEVHFVHVSDEGEISVIGVFFKKGKENEFLKGIIANMPTTEGNKSIITSEICPGNIFKTTDEFYIYEGSLTTPPCTEGVNWFVRRKCMEASAEQIKALSGAMPVNNARPVQELNERVFGVLD